MTKQDIIKALTDKGYNNNASATQQDLYSTINRGQLFSGSNRLNSGWARGKFVIASHDDTSYSIDEYIEQWRQKVERFENQTLCIEVNPKEWEFYNYMGDQIDFIVLPPSFDKNMNTIENDLLKFKHILEYFCAHLMFFVTKDIKGIGYDSYIKKYIDEGTFKYSGQGYNNDNIQNQIKRWESLSPGRICINVYGSAPQGLATYLHWDSTGHNISAIWDNNKITSLQLFEFVETPQKKWDAGRKFSLDELGLFDNQRPNIKLIEFYNLFVNMLNKINIVPKFRPYITAIKSKPFLLLAGISGTGKSRIVRELARACWDAGSEEYKAHKPKNFEMVQVKPNWHDSSELIGYVSRIDGEKFVVGPFLKFLVKAINDPEHPYFLCLDEMNLAPVEQYFAEYLSVVESRKVNEDGEVITDPIIDYEATEAYHSLIDQLFPGDLENRKAYLTEEGGKRLTIPKNLIVVGTVNMDETTFSFSRKVLDRAMTIEMNEVDLHGGLTKRHEQIGKLGNAELVGNAVEGVDVYEAHKDICDMVIEYLEAVNGKLEGTPFKIAYRTRNEFLLYVVNNLPYNKDEEDDDLDQNYVIARALDEITSMKILSRIEGDETKVPEKLLKSLEDTIKEQLEAIFDGPFGIKEDDDNFKSISLAKLNEMKKKLTSGYTSFWS